MADRDPLIAHLVEVRKSHGLSIAKLAEKLGWKAIVLGSYERGDRNATVTRVREWAAGLGLELTLLGPAADTAGNTWVEYAARYRRSGTADGRGLIVCDDVDEAVAVAACMHGGEVVWRRVNVTDWEA